MPENSVVWVGWRKRTDVPDSHWEMIDSTKDESRARCYEKLQAACYLVGSEPAQFLTQVLLAGQTPAEMGGTYRHRALRPGW